MNSPTTGGAEVSGSEVSRPSRRSKTWGQLSGTRRKPSEYEIVSHNLNYHYDRAPAPFELDESAPLNGWYLRYREGSPLRVPDWNTFRDPRKLTYRAYVEQQSKREIYLDGVVDRYESAAHRADLSAEWVATLARLYLTSRYSCHVMQMAAMYLAQIAPSSYVTNCAEFQAGDEMRRIQRIAYRAKALASAGYSALGETATARSTWEDDAAWQPMRECLERLLVAYDWGEAFVALNLCVKPMHDALLITELGDVARRMGDDELALTVGDFGLDSERSAQWSSALTRFALENEPSTRSPIEGWLQTWRPRAAAGVDALSETLAGNGPASDPRTIQAAIQERYDGFLVDCGLAPVPVG